MSVIEQSPHLRSQPSRSLSFVRFHNVTQRQIDVIWINYEGSRVKYKTLGPKEFCDVNTYVAHPWVFQDTITHETLHANSKDVYEPDAWFEAYLPGLKSGKLQAKDLQPKRVVVNITTPLYSLKSSAMIAVLTHLKTPDHVKNLEIPRQCQEELLELMKRVQRNFC